MFYGKKLGHSHHNSWRQRNLHVQWYSSLFKKGVKNMGNSLHHIKLRVNSNYLLTYLLACLCAYMHTYIHLKSLLLKHSFYSADEILLFIFYVCECIFVLPNDKDLVSFNLHNFGYSVSFDSWIFACVIVYCILFFHCCILYVCHVYKICM
jgi:hypothetical protein